MEHADPDEVMGVKQPMKGFARLVGAACDIAANGLPIGRTGARLAVDVQDLNNGEGRPKPAVVIGVKGDF